MKQIEESGYYYPDPMAHAYLQALENIMGTNGFNAVLHLAHLPNLVAHRPSQSWERSFDFAYLSALNGALEELFGPQGGRWLQVRGGRACFAKALQGKDGLAMVREPRVTRLPLRAKLEIGIPTLAQVINRVSDQEGRVDQRSEYYFYIIDRCPDCWGRTADHPVCFPSRGLLQEGLLWVSGGHEFQVEEIECQAMGDPSCTFAIYKTPVA